MFWMLQSLVNRCVRLKEMFEAVSASQCEDHVVR